MATWLNKKIRRIRCTFKNYVYPSSGNKIAYDVFTIKYFVFSTKKKTQKTLDTIVLLMIIVRSCKIHCHISHQPSNLLQIYQNTYICQYIIDKYVFCRFYNEICYFGFFFFFLNVQKNTLNSTSTIIFSFGINFKLDEWIFKVNRISSYFTSKVFSVAYFIHTRDSDAYYIRIMHSSRLALVTALKLLTQMGHSSWAIIFNGGYYFLFIYKPSKTYAPP